MALSALQVNFGSAFQTTWYTTHIIWTGIPVLVLRCNFNCYVVLIEAQRRQKLAHRTPPISVDANSIYFGHCYEGYMFILFCPALSLLSRVNETYFIILYWFLKNLNAIYEQIVWRMWEPRRLATLWDSTACYRDSFTFMSLRIWYNLNDIPGEHITRTYIFQQEASTAAYVLELDPEDGSSKFLRNLGELLPDYILLMRSLVVRLLVSCLS
jgi:hypothetical protein